MERDNLWLKVIEPKFRVDHNGWCYKELRGPYGVGVWKSLERG